MFNPSEHTCRATAKVAYTLAMNRWSTKVWATIERPESHKSFLSDPYAKITPILDHLESEIAELVIALSPACPKDKLTNFQSWVDRVTEAHNSKRFHDILEAMNDSDYDSSDLDPQPCIADIIEEIGDILSYLYSLGSITPVDWFNILDRDVKGHVYLDDAVAAFMEFAVMVSQPTHSLIRHYAMVNSIPMLLQLLSLLMRACYSKDEVLEAFMVVNCYKYAQAHKGDPALIDLANLSEDISKIMTVYVPVDLRWVNGEKIDSYQDCYIGDVSWPSESTLCDSSSQLRDRIIAETEPEREFLDQVDSVASFAPRLAHLALSAVGTRNYDVAALDSSLADFWVSNFNPSASRV